MNDDALFTETVASAIEVVTPLGAGAPGGLVKTLSKEIKDFGEKEALQGRDFCTWMKIVSQMIVQTNGLDATPRAQKKSGDERQGGILK